MISSISASFVHNTHEWSHFYKFNFNIAIWEHSIITFIFGTVYTRLFQLNATKFDRGLLVWNWDGFSRNIIFSAHPLRVILPHNDSDWNRVSISYWNFRNWKVGILLFLGTYSQKTDNEYFFDFPPTIFKVETIVRFKIFLFPNFFTKINGFTKSFDTIISSSFNARNINIKNMVFSEFLEIIKLWIPSFTKIS